MYWPQDILQSSGNQKSLALVQKQSRSVEKNRGHRRKPIHVEVNMGKLGHKVDPSYVVLAPSVLTH